MQQPYYTCIYNTYNDNVYVLICIIFVLGFIIFFLDYWKQNKNTMIQTLLSNERIIKNT